MKRFAVLVVALLAAGLIGPTPAGATHEGSACLVPAGVVDDCVDVEVPAPGLAVPDRHVRILLPPGYDPDCSSARYPVLYLLHGAGDTYKTWVENTDVEDFTDDHGVIVVMPDGGHGATTGNEAGWYSDWADDSRDWESFHTGAVVDYVDAEYCTKGDDHRALAGLSMGGFGALKYLARHPDTFDAAASFSGAVDTMYGWPASGPFFSFLHGQFGTPDDRVWGNQLAAHENWRAHNPTDLARNGAFNDKTVLVTTGTGTPGGHAGDDFANPGGYGLEHFIWQMHGTFDANLTVGGGASNPNGGHPAAGPAPADWFYPGGLHAWPYWESALHWALPELVDAVGGPPPLPVQAEARGQGRGVRGR